MYRFFLNLDYINLGLIEVCFFWAPGDGVLVFVNYMYFVYSVCVFHHRAFLACVLYLLVFSLV